MRLPDAATAVLEQARIVRLATVTPSGAPHAAPFWFCWDGERIVVSTLENATVRNVRHEPRIAVLVDLGETFEDLRGALIGGTARAYAPDEASERVRRAAEAVDRKHAAEVETPLFRDYMSRETRAPVYLDIIPERVQWFDLAHPGGRSRAKGGT